MLITTPAGAGGVPGCPRASRRALQAQVGCLDACAPADERHTRHRTTCDAIATTTNHLWPAARRAPIALAPCSHMLEPRAQLLPALGARGRRAGGHPPVLGSISSVCAALRRLLCCLRLILRGVCTLLARLVQARAVSRCMASISLSAGRLAKGGLMPRPRCCESASMPGGSAAGCLVRGSAGVGQPAARTARRAQPAGAQRTLPGRQQGNSPAAPNGGKRQRHGVFSFGHVRYMPQRQYLGQPKADAAAAGEPAPLHPTCSCSPPPPSRSADESLASYVHHPAHG